MKSILRSLLIIILVIVQSSVFTRALFAQNVDRQAISETADLTARLAAIEKTVEERRQTLGIPGLSLVIIAGDKVIFMKGFGLRDLEKRLPVTPETLFGIGSATKAFTAMTMAMSADDGKLSFDDSPKKFLPFFKLRDRDADAQVTLRDLLSHRTGLDRTDLSLQFTGKLTREDLIKIAGLAKPTANFREKWQYQNTMFVAAGEAAAKANNTSWENLIAERIFKPLKMNSSDTSIIEMQRSKDFSLGYDYNPETKETKNLKSLDETLAAPAGAINSNARDMSQWLKLMLGGGVFEGKRLVSEKNFNELVARQIQIAPKADYGFGWFLTDWQGHKEVQHGGNLEGFSTMVAMIPDEHIGFVMLSNVSYSPLQNEIRRIVWSNLLGQTAAATETKTSAETTKPQTAISEISTALKELAGSYESERSGKTVDIAAGDGAAFFQLEGQPPMKLIEKTKDEFAVEGLPEGFSLSVKRDENGKTNGFLFNQQGVVAKFRRQIPLAVNVEDVMKKVVEAAGGEANLRKHTSMQMEMTVDLEGEGMTGEATAFAKAPNLSATDLKYFALGKEVGANLDYFDGKNGGSVATFGTPFLRSGKMLEDARIASDFYAPLDWQTLYQKVSIKKMSKIGDEDVYVVEKIPANGNTIIDYVSTKSFLVLRRESAQPTGFNAMTVPFTENFSDYKLVDGVMLPYKIIAGIPHSGVSVTIVKSVKFNVDIPDSAFRPLR